MSNSEQRRTVPFLWGTILVLGALLAGAIFLLVRPDSSQSNEPNLGSETAQSPTDEETSPEAEESPSESETDEEIPPTGPLRAKLTDAVGGFHVDSWVESAGLLKVGALESYEGFYVQDPGATAAETDDTS